MHFSFPSPSPVSLAGVAVSSPLACVDKQLDMFSPGYFCDLDQQAMVPDELSPMPTFEVDVFAIPAREFKLEPVATPNRRAVALAAVTCDAASPENADYNDDSYPASSCEEDTNPKRKTKKVTTADIVTVRRKNGHKVGKTREDFKTEAEYVRYRDRRDRNNLAANKSREAKRAVLDSIDHRATELQQENFELRTRIDALTKEIGYLSAVVKANTAGKRVGK